MNLIMHPHVLCLGLLLASSNAAAVSSTASSTAASPLVTTLNITVEGGNYPLHIFLLNTSTPNKYSRFMEPIYWPR